jgi:hypothetical protein
MEHVSRLHNQLLVHFMKPFYLALTFRQNKLVRLFLVLILVYHYTCELD